MVESGDIMRPAAEYLSRVDTVALDRIKNGTAKNLDLNFLCGRIARHTTPWAESQSLLNEVLSRPNLYDDVTIAEVMCAGVVRADRALQNGETDDNHLGTWQEDHLMVPELKKYRDQEPARIPNLASLLLNRLIHQKRIGVHKLAEVGLSILPHLFEGEPGDPLFMDIENLHTRLFKSRIDIGDKLADLAVRVGDEKARQITKPEDAGLKNIWLYHSRYSAARMHFISGDSEKAMELINDKAITDKRHKLFLNIMASKHNLQHSRGDSMITSHLLNADSALDKLNEDRELIIVRNRALLEFALALLHNPGAATDDLYIEQARRWLSSITSLNDDFASALIKRLFGDRESYIELVVLSNKGKDRSPRFLTDLIYLSKDRDKGYILAEPLMEDVIDYIREGELAQPKVDIADAAAVMPDRSYAIKYIFELTRIVSKKCLRGNAKTEQTNFYMHFL